MSSKHYDIAIIGGSLTAQIAAALLAKNGTKVLFLSNQEIEAPAWFHSSIFLEKLLGILGGRSCFVSPQAFQVISERSRVTIGSDIPLEKEWQREFGSSADSVKKWFDQLHLRGEQLEQLLWDNGGVPWHSIKAAAGFKLLCLRRKINLALLETPVSEWIKELPVNARTFVIDLFQGLSLRKIEDLSYARAAMLWAQALRPENLQEPDFSEMLKKRFDQFRGAKGVLDDLASLDFNGTTWTGGKFKAGGQFTANIFLLGDKDALDFFNKGKALRIPSPYAPTARLTSDLSGQLSTLLGSRVICGGRMPLRIAIKEHEQQQYGVVLSAPEASEAEIRQQLEPALPFIDYTFSETNGALNHDPVAKQASLASLPIRIQANLYQADRTALLPEMGAAGAALLAWTIFRNLTSTTKQEKE